MIFDVIFKSRPVDLERDPIRSRVRVCVCMCVCVCVSIKCFICYLHSIST